jgi:hypothetical protein
MALTGLVDRIDRGEASDAERAVHRFLVNVNKYATSIRATEVVHQGIEVLGGNGTIESFSVLPRLYRDAVVYESWEGTHNVLCAQVQRDCARLHLLDDVVRWIEGELSRAKSADTGPVESALRAIQPRLEESVAAGERDGGGFRRLLDGFARVIQAATMLAEASSGGDEKHAVAALFVQRHLGDGSAVAGDVVDAALAGDLG